MKAIITYIVVSLIAMICCAENQTVVKGKFVGYDYDFTKNKTFINITYLFSTDSGTVRINKKQFYADVKKKTFIDYGLAIIQRFHVDTTYTIVLQQIRAADFIPKKYPVTYYQTNCKVDTGDTFIEYRNDVPFKKYSWENDIQWTYVDINKQIYKILKITPQKLEDLLWFKFP